MDMFKKLAQQLKKDIVNSKPKSVSLPMFEEFMTPKNVFFKKMSERAVELYEHKSDVNKFSEMVLSDPENTSHNDIMQDLFSNGVIDPFEESKLSELTDNKKFLRDLGLL